MKTPKWLPYSAPADGAAKDVWDALTLMDASMDGSWLSGLYFVVSYVFYSFSYQKGHDTIHLGGKQGRCMMNV